MEFIKQMKKREFIEMSLKTLAAVLAAFLAIILMEGMIYGINLNALKTKGKTTMSNTSYTVAYCIEEDDDKYFVIYYNEGQTDNGASSDWSAVANSYKTKAECTKENLKVSKVVFGAPNAFEFSITPIHYVIMVVFVLAVGGFFTYKFIKLNKTYKQIEDEFNKTGTIEFTNQ